MEGNNDISLYGSICLSDIPKNLIYRAANGKAYLNVNIRRRQQPDRFGNTFYVKVRVRQGEVVPEGATLFVGSLKESAPWGGSQQERQLNDQLQKVQEFIDTIDEGQQGDLPF